MRVGKKQCARSCRRGEAGCVSLHHRDTEAQSHRSEKPQIDADSIAVSTQRSRDIARRKHKDTKAPRRHKPSHFWGGPLGALMLLNFVEAAMGSDGHLPRSFRPPCGFYDSQATSTLRNADSMIAMLGSTLRWMSFVSSCLRVCDGPADGGATAHIRISVSPCLCGSIPRECNRSGAVQHPVPMPPISSIPSEVSLRSLPRGTRCDEPRGRHPGHG